MRMLPQTLSGFQLLSFSYRGQWGATFQDALYARPDGTCQLHMVSDHPDFEDEVLELTEAEGEDWVSEVGPHHCPRPPEPGETFLKAVRVREGGGCFAVAARSS